METTMNKLELIPAIRRRRSGVAFADTPVTDEILQTIFKAGQWAASSYNEQPWYFFFGHKGTPEFEALLSTAKPNNQAWAKHAPVLILAAAKTTNKQGAPNLHAWHDVGAAVAQMNLQAVHLGLFMHQMAGFSSEKAREVAQLPETFEAVELIALGYHGDESYLPESLQAREHKKRERRPIDQTVFQGNFTRAVNWK